MRYYICNMAEREMEQFRTIPMGRSRPLAEYLKPGDRIRTVSSSEKRQVFIHDPQGVVTLGSRNVEIVRKS